MSDRVLRFPDRTWDELERLPQPLRNAAHRTIFHLPEEPVVTALRVAVKETMTVLGRLVGIVLRDAGRPCHIGMLTPLTVICQLIVRYPMTGPRLAELPGVIPES